MKKTALFAAATVIAILAVSCKSGSTKSGAAGPASEDAPVNVVATTVTVKDVPQEEVYSTTVQAWAVNNIVPQAAGRIKVINVEVGDFVREGQILAEMDAVSLEQSRLRLVNDSTELSRLKALKDEGGISQSDYEAAELSYKVNKKNYENLLENTILRSPLSGVVTARNYDKGDFYSMSQPIYVVQQITPVKLLAGISEADYTRVHRGDKVYITADALPGREFEGKVSRIYPTIDPASHTFTAEITVPNSDRVLRPGMYARVKITFELRRSMVVPDGAVVKQQGSGVRSVYVIDSDNTVSICDVTLGRHTEGEYEILSGLEEGQTIIVKGQSMVKNGSKVTFQSPAEK